MGSKLGPDRSGAKQATRVTPSSTALGDMPAANHKSHQNKQQANAQPTQLKTRPVYPGPPRQDHND